MYRQHSPDDLRHIAGRLKSVVKIIEKIADDMGKVNCETLKLQSDTIVNTRLPYIEQWVMETSGKAQSQLHKLALDQAAFQLGQQYAASKSAEKPQKTPGKRGGSGGGKR